ncbi:MAG: radical SAM/SPASM domain-containing protein [Planctomycetota bacterium]|nr:radical SAM/SPASM domain-containing protein [Planctomycetota bacterium]
MEEAPDYPSLTRENERSAVAAEMSGSPVVEAWPTKYTLELTADCNLHCFMCDCEMARDTYRAEGFKSFKLPVEMFRQIAEAGFPRATYVNPTVVGEPFMLAYWDELVEACERYHVRLDLISNGMLLDEKRLRRVLPVLSSLTISFDGGTKATFDHIRTGAKFERVLDNLATFRRLRNELGLRHQAGLRFGVTILRENVAELPRIVELAHEYEVDLLTAGFLIVVSEELRSSSPLGDPERTNHWIAAAKQRALELRVKARFPEPLPTDGSVAIDVVETDTAFAARSDADEVTSPMEAALAASLASEAASAAERGAGAADTTAPTVEAAAPSLAGTCASKAAAESEAAAPFEVLGDEIPDGWKGKTYCHFPWKEVFVGQGGEIAPCCGQGRPVFGNAFEQDFSEIWNGPGYQALRKGIWTGEVEDYCRECPMLQFPKQA